ncbi:MAG: hypothetical protein JWP97_5797 [Labilithrix sp.]|nr:hypothetical protein [Labilithrix sp.]
MTNDKPLSAAESRAAAAGAWRVAAWGLAIYLGTRIAAVAFESAAMPAAVAQAVLTEWGVGRLGVSWSDPKAREPSASAIARRAGIGALIGGVVAVLLVGFLATTRAVVLDRVTPATSAVVVALVTARLYAMRDELLFHGVLLRALVSVDAPVAKVLACGLTSAAAAYGEVGVLDPAPILVKGLLGLVFGALWVRDRGAWMAWGAHATFLFTSSALMQGGLFEAHVAAGAWGGGALGPLAGQAAVVALLPVGLGAVVGAARPGRPAPSLPPA